jgi:ABC-type dipeptide/oligopeptide/nickel transport system permease subunit
MKAPFAKFSPFQVDPEKIEETFGIQQGDFELASDSEKESMVEMHKSISFWKDAWRRFRANTVSMVALFVFIACLFFAFIGPYLIPYNYADQYRTSQKLGPFEYSEGEQAVHDIEKLTDGFYATALRPGSITALDPGEYYLKSGKDIYAFTLTETTDNSIILIDKSAPDKLRLVKSSDVRDGSYSTYTAIPYSNTPSEGATQLKTFKRVFPHVFGTDSSGRDIMARTMYGARVSIIIGVVAAIIVLIIGSIYGAISGLAGGAVDFVMMRIVELIYSVPEVLIVLLLQVVLKDPLQAWFQAHSDTSAFVKAMSDLGAGIVSIFITFAVLYWVTMARIIRGQVLMLKKQEYVTAATALGASNGRIIRKHLLPNCIGPLVITTCLQIPSAIFLESFLSFLGLGVSAPMASLGSLCSDALQTIQLYPYRLVFPAVILTIIVLTLNLVGDGLRDALDPRLKK